MKRLAGIALIIIALSSGGIGIAMLGGGLAVPAFLVFAFGVYFLVTSFNKEENNKNKDEDEKIFGKKNVGQLFLGILILIFGIINLVNASLIVVSVIAIVVGGGLIYYNLSGSKKEEPRIEKKKERKKKTKKPKDSGGGYATLIFVVLFGFLAVMIYQSMNSETNQQKKIQKQKETNYRTHSVYKDEVALCKKMIINKYPKKKFVEFNFSDFWSPKNQKSYLKTIKMWMKHDGLIRKNKFFGKIDCFINVKSDQSITFNRLGDKYK
tara:strand:- start:18 stop:815 length:798 start_codon:yes stop_codon:yes gene_type:complete